MIVILASRTGDIFCVFLAEEKTKRAWGARHARRGNARKNTVLRLPPSRTVSSAPRSLRACLRSSEKRQKNTPVLSDIVTFL